MPELPEVQHLHVDAVVPNRYQPRQAFSPQELAELAASLKQSGLLQPVLVRRKGDGMYELISGERRWRAAKEAGMETIQAVIRNCSDEESILLALVENLQREDLNPMEMARAYDERIWTHAGHNCAASWLRAVLHREPGPSHSSSNGGPATHRKRSTLRGSCEGDSGARQFW
jgi:ParB/RepB/Spo0J family partition protein